MYFRFIQPYQDYSCRLAVSDKDKVRAKLPVYFARYRYPHHAMASGYDRLCDYMGETIRVSKPLYWLGETVLRIPAVAVSRLCGHYEYSRYVFILELEVIRHFLKHSNSIYHYVYGDKCYNLLSHYAGRNGNKIVVTIHQPPEKNSWMFRSMDHFKKADLVTVVSRSQLPYWESLVGKDKVVYVPYAVDTSYFTPATRTESLRRPRCIFAGAHERDFDCLSRLVPQVLAADANVEFVMVSSDRRCEPIARDNPRAVWRRRVEDDEYRTLLQDSDLLVLPADRSTTNTAVLEAMACGVPVITNSGGIEDYLDPLSSRIFPVGDDSGMATAACELLANPEQLAAMSVAARKQACEFSWTQTAGKMLTAYQRLIPS